MATLNESLAPAIADTASDYRAARCCAMASSPQSMWTEWNEQARFSVVISVLIVAILTLDYWVVSKTQMSGAYVGLSKSWPGILLIIAAGLYSQKRGFRRLAEICPIAASSLVAHRAIYLLVQCAARTSASLIDGKLAKLDAGVGFSTAAVVRLAAAFPTARLLLAVSYALVGPLMAAAILVPAIAGRSRDSRRYVVSVTVAAIITAAAFACWPAVGPWSVEGYPPLEPQAAVESYLHALKSSGAILLDFNRSNLVSFPSFHVVLALLAAAAMWSIRGARYTLSVLAFATCLSTLVTGWHYLIDIAGGAVAAGVSYWVAGKLLGIGAVAGSRDDSRS